MPHLQTLSSLVAMVKCLKDAGLERRMCGRLSSMVLSLLWCVGRVWYKDDMDRNTVFETMFLSLGCEKCLGAWVHSAKSVAAC
jgi:hypothetical protein